MNECYRKLDCYYRKGKYCHFVEVTKAGIDKPKACVYPVFSNQIDGIVLIIEKEISERGFLCDSDKTDRIIDDICDGFSANDDEREALVFLTTEYCLENYNMIDETINGDYCRYFYRNDLKFETIYDLEEYFGIGE